MAGLARRVDGNEDWTSIWVYDHVHTVPRPAEEATHEAWSLMAAFAAVTGRVRLGQMCTCMGYRNPAHLAKVAATVDVISEGRLDVGIGAGWYEHEWRAYGYGFPSAGERIAALGEGIEIMRQMWTTGHATYAGEHLTADGALCFPRPLQGESVPGSRRNGIPLWVAGGGERKTLRIAAKYADYTNFSPRPEEFSAKSEVLRRHCDDVGRDFDEIVRSADYNVVIGRDEAEVRDRMGWIRDHYTRAGLPQDLVDREVRSVREGRARRDPGTDHGDPGRPRGAGHDLRDHLLRRAGLRPQWRRAVRARGRPLARQPRTAQQPLALPPRPVGLSAGAAAGGPAGVRGDR